MIREYYFNLKKKKVSSETFNCLHHYGYTSKKGITQIIVKRKNLLMYLNFQAKIFANNFRHQCFFTVMTELFLVHVTGTQLINI